MPNEDEDMLQVTLDALATLFEAHPDLDSRHLLTNVEQLQHLLHEASVYLGKLSQAARMFPFFGAVLPADEQDFPTVCLNLAAICHYVSCQHQEDEDYTETVEDEREEHLEWPQQPPFQIFD